jgi:hypothetical protein
VTCPNRAFAAFATVLLVLATGCGYHVAGRADLVPKSVDTIAVLPFGSASNRYKLSDKVQQAISRELISRTRFHVVRDPAAADAVLEGSLGNVLVIPVVFDPQTFKTTVVQISGSVQAKLTDRKTGKVIYDLPGMPIQNSYQLSEYPSQYFDESGLALDRMANDIGRTLVSGMLENF